jgi:hypothetical protein
MGRRRGKGGGMAAQLESERQHARINQTPHVSSSVGRSIVAPPGGIIVVNRKPRTRLPSRWPFRTLSNFVDQF